VLAVPTREAVVFSSEAVSLKWRKVEGISCQQLLLQLIALIFSQRNSTPQIHPGRKHLNGTQHGSIMLTIGTANFALTGIHGISLSIRCP
jgi:hypothetical protein